MGSSLLGGVLRRRTMKKPIMTSIQLAGKPGSKTNEHNEP
jgi:hypothetical protein